MKIEELKFDDKNFNRGTVKGQKLIRESFSQFKAGRSILIDKNNRIIAGNKSAQAAIENGVKEVHVVESNGEKIIAVKRMDIDLSSEEGRNMAFIDNATALYNIEFDFDLVEEEIDLKKWGIEINNEINEKIKERESVDSTLIADLYLNVKVDSERDAAALYEELKKRGYECKIVS
jgi:hypothetical protein